MRKYQVTYNGIYSLFCFLILICSRNARVAGDVIAVGSADGTAENGLPQVGRSFLVSEINQAGILFAISAYFVRQTNVSFQIWRPVDGPAATPDQTAKRFRLIWQLTTTSSIAGYREDIYMEAKFLRTCAVVRPGDWFGVVHLTSPAAIGAPFVGRDVILPKMNDETDGIGQVIGLNATFDMTFKYPYNLLMAAYIFTVNASGLQMSDDTTACPSAVLIPSWTNPYSTTTAPMLTYPPGATGASGETGQRGPVGATGASGSPGPAGVVGPMGQPGPIGLPGAPGPKGQLGSPGVQGQKGPLGLPGLSGTVGAQGDTGQAGPLGPPGNDTYHYEFPPNAQPVQSDDLQSDGGLADRAELRMGAIIWLSILSAIVVFSALMLIFVCYFVADDRRVQKNEAAWIEPAK